MAYWLKKPGNRAWDGLPDEGVRGFSEEDELGIPRRSLKKRNITPSKNELPHIGSNVAFEENMIEMQHWHTDNQEKDEKQSQNDKTGLGMEKL
ncbi:hypothetical protein Tco_0500373 [Tanacetum coccineum]